MMRAEQATGQVETRRFLNHVFGCGCPASWVYGPGYRMVRCACTFLAWRPR